MINLIFDDILYILHIFLNCSYNSLFALSFGRCVSSLNSRFFSCALNCKIYIVCRYLTCLQWFHGFQTIIINSNNIRINIQHSKYPLNEKNWTSLAWLFRASKKLLNSGILKPVGGGLAGSQVRLIR